MNDLISDKTIRWDLYFLRVAKAVATGSRCAKRQVGCIIVDKNNRIVSSGFNGKPRLTDCDAEECLRLNIPSGEQMSVSCCRHSEISALIYGSFNDFQGGNMYVTFAPCELCAPEVLQSGISNLIFLKDHRRGGLEYIAKMTHKSHRLNMREYDLENNTVAVYLAGKWFIYPLTCGEATV